MSGVSEWKIFYLSTKNSPNRVLLLRNFIWGRFQTFAITKLLFYQVDTRYPIHRI